MFSFLIVHYRTNLLRQERMKLNMSLGRVLAEEFQPDVLKWLRQKVELNRLQGTEAERRAIVECRVELRRLSSWHSYVVNIVVVAFVVFVLVLGLDMIAAAEADPLYRHIHLAMVVFLILFATLSSGLMLLAGFNAFKVKHLLP